jgi:hypothetical protein
LPDDEVLRLHKATEPIESDNPQAAVCPVDLPKPRMFRLRRMGAFASAFTVGAVVTIEVLRSAVNPKSWADAIFPDEWKRHAIDWLGDTHSGESSNSVLKKLGVWWKNSVPPPRPATFTVGSSAAEVISVQGRPDRIEGDVWYYGAAWVRFDNDVVAGWKATPANPLRVR